MKNFNLQALFQISGIGSASGLVHHDNSLFIISDNSSFLYEFDTIQQKLNKIKLFENSQENIPKIDKFDFESITKKGNKLHIFGSGSTSKRNKHIGYNLENKKVNEKEVTQLYSKFKKQGQLSDCDLNIEGAFHYSSNWYFFQRGNGAQSQNGLFIYNKNTKEVRFQSIVLPKIQHIEASFTDAILVDKKIYFLAAVENTISTYDDGEILGSFMGSMDLETLALNFTLLISNNHKFEGLTLLKNSEKEIEFLLCEDNDTETLETTIYKLTIAH